LVFDHLADVAKPRPRAASAFPPAAPGRNDQQLENDRFHNERAGVSVFQKLRLKLSDKPQRFPALNVEWAAILQLDPYAAQHCRSNTNDQAPTGFVKGYSPALIRGKE